MRIAGVQKLTLLDFPSVVACTVFTLGCNFKCPFCHNAHLVFGECADKLEADDVLEFLKQRKGILEGVVITGGEPLLNLDIGAFLSKIKELGYLIKLDTNGTNPKLLRELVENKSVDYVAMDIKNSPDDYLSAVGDVKLNIEDVEASKNFLLEGTVDYEFRTTVVKGIHTEKGLLALAEWISGAEKYFLQQFKDSGELLSPDGLSEFSLEELKVFAENAKKHVRSVEIRGI